MTFNLFYFQCLPNFFNFFLFLILIYFYFYSQRYGSEIASLSALQETSQTLSLQVVACEERAARSEADLRIEREWRTSLQEQDVANKEQINGLQISLKEMTDETRKNEKIKKELEQLKQQWNEDQSTLEELGVQLSVSKLQISDLKEKANESTTGGAKNTQSDPGGGGGGWTPDSMTTKCKGCTREFSITRRKHHCRNCGEIFCKNCSEQVAPLPNEQGQLTKPVRVCDSCWDILNLY